MHRSRWLTRGPVRLVVGAGSVVDELLAGRPLGTVGADRVAVAAHLVATGQARTDDVTAALVAAGLVAPLRTKVWGLFPRDGLQRRAAVGRRSGPGRAWPRRCGPARCRRRPTPALAALAGVGGLARVHVPGGAARPGRAARSRSTP